MRRRTEKKHRLLKLVIWLLVIGWLVNHFFGVSFHVSLPRLSRATPTPSVYLSPTPDPLAHVVQSQLLDAKGTYSVIVKNLRTGQTYKYNPNHSYETASLYKVWILATVYQKIQAGGLREDQELSANIADLNREFNIASDEAEQVDGTTDYTVSDALEKMIVISDNYSALLLTHNITYPVITDFLNKNGLKGSHVGIGEASPVTTPDDMVSLFEKLYSNKLIDKEYTDKMINLLTRTEFNTVIPKYLPKETKIAHKTGSLEFISHDVGIVFRNRGDYILAVFSQSDVPVDAEDRMAKVSKAVYEYFKNQKDPEPPKPEPVRYDLFIGIIGAIGLALFIYYEYTRIHKPTDQSVRQ